MSLQEYKNKGYEKISLWVFKIGLITFFVYLTKFWPWAPVSRLILYLYLSSYSAWISLNLAISLLSLISTSIVGIFLKKVII